jgi:hypothetical protein
VAGAGLVVEEAPAAALQAEEVAGGQEAAAQLSGRQHQADGALVPDGPASATMVGPPPDRMLAQLWITARRAVSRGQPGCRQ